MNGRCSILATLTTAIVALALSLPTGATGARPLPDLIVSQSFLRQSVLLETRTFLDTDCAVQEGMISAGTHSLVRFGTQVINQGRADLNLDKPSAGDPNYEFFACHNHWHFVKFAEYRLRDASGAIVGVGHKQSFCILDSGPYFSWSPPHAHYTCDDQGLSRGWYDIYDSGLDGQWIIVDGVPPGTYTLEAEIDYARALGESDYGNNVATAVVTIP